MIVRSTEFQDGQPEGVPKNAALIFHAKHFLTAAAILIVFDCIRNVAAGGLRGLKDTRSNMFSSLIGYWLIGLPAAYGLGKILGFGGDGLWAGLILGIIISASILLVRFQKLYPTIQLNDLLIK